MADPERGGGSPKTSTPRARVRHRLARRIAARGGSRHAASLGPSAAGFVDESYSTTGTAAFRLRASDKIPGARRRADFHHGLLALAIAGALCLLTPSCLPTLPPSHAIEDFTYLGAHLEVTASALPVFGAFGLERSELLPGDTIRLTPHFAHVDGVVEPGSITADFFFCGGIDCRLVFDAPACERVQIGRSGTCHLGRFEILELTLDGALDTEEIGALLAMDADELRWVTPTFTIVVQDPASRERPCLERLAAIRAEETLWDCAVGVRRAMIGPPAALIREAEAQGVELPPPLQNLPDALHDDYPNFNPAIREIVVSERRSDGTIRTQLIAPRESVVVAPGAGVDIDIVPRYYEMDQGYHDLHGNAFGERLSHTWFVMHTAPEVLAFAPASDFARFSSADPQARDHPLVIAMVVSDGRLSELVEWIHVEIRDP